MTTRVTAGPFTLELPPNGVAVLYEADKGGADHCLPGGVGYLEALVQFAGEVTRLRAMVGQMQTDRVDQQSVGALVRAARTLLRCVEWRVGAMPSPAPTLHEMHDAIAVARPALALFAEDRLPRSSCDVCGAEDRPTTTVIAYGIETNACDKCRGEP